MTVEHARRIWDATPFMRTLGARLVRVDAGECESVMPLVPPLLQQDGYAHAGVLAGLADHTAGCAAGTLLDEGWGVLSIAFTIHLLRPAAGGSLRCAARVVKPGRSVSVAEADVYAVANGGERLAARLTVTLAVREWHPAPAPQDTEPRRHRDTES